MTEDNVRVAVNKELLELEDKFKNLSAKLQIARTAVTEFVNQCNEINRRKAKLKGILDATK